MDNRDEDKMEQKYLGDENEKYNAAQRMVERAFRDEEHFGRVEELYANINNPDRFLEIVKSDPHCEIIRRLAFAAQEGDNIPEDSMGTDIRPAGEVAINDRGERYVGGWQVDELGFYAVPQNMPPEVFKRRKTLWLSQNILGARRIGETDREHQKRIEDLKQRIDQYYRNQEEGTQG